MQHGQVQDPTGNSLSKKIKNFIFNQKDQIGKGYSSTVFKGINELTKEEIAVKVVELAKIKNEVQRYLLNNEMRALRKLEHPHILRCYDILMTKNNIYIVTEFCRGGDLVSLVKQSGRLTESQALHYLKEIVEGYCFVEDNGILHRDLKTANIFLNNGSTRIADFGFCEFIGEARPSIAYNVGSPAYMSPESFRESVYSSKSDVWSIGIIFFEMLVGEVPFKKLEYIELATNLVSGNLGIPPAVTVSEGSRAILVGCFKEKLNERLEPKKLLEMVNNELRKRPQKLQLVPSHGLRSSHDLFPAYTQPPKPSAKQQPPVPQPPPHPIILNGPSKIGISPQRSLELSQAKTETQARAENELMRHYIEYIMFMYRLVKMLVEGRSVLPCVQHINHILIIALKNRSTLYSEIQSLLNVVDPELNSEFQFLRSRFEDVGVNSETLDISDPALKTIAASSPFRTESSMRVYLAHIKSCIAELDRSLEQNQQVAGAVLDYLMLYHELLVLQLAGANITEVIRTAHLTEILKEKPKQLSDVHVRLLRAKRGILGI